MTDAAAENVPAIRIPSLDGLRAIAILLVVISHLMLRAQGSPDPAVRGATRLLLLGNLGVTVFFVISGFLITTLLTDELARTGTVSLRSFYLRRTLRIFPAYYAYLACIAVGGAAGWVDVHGASLLRAVTYTVNYAADPGWVVGHAWSLSVEEQFYLLWPAVVTVAGLRRGIRAGAACLLVCPVLRLAHAIAHPGDDPVRPEFQFIADALATGCLLAVGREWLHARTWYRDALSSRWAPWIPAVALLMAELPYRRRICPVWAYAFVAVSIGHLAIAFSIDRVVTHPESWQGRFLNRRALIWLGSLSYSIYLWQQPFLDPRGDRPWQHFPLNIGLVAIFALLSAHVVERPALRYRARWEARHRLAPEPGRAARAL